MGGNGRPIPPYLPRSSSEYRRCQSTPRDRCSTEGPMSDHTTISAPILGSRRRRMAMSVAEAANEANIGRDGIYEAIWEGRLEARKWGRRTLITDEALEPVSKVLERKESPVILSMAADSGKAGGCHVDGRTAQ